MNRIKTEKPEAKKRKFSLKLPSFELNDQSKRSIGIVSLCVAVFSLISFISYLFTYQADYSIVQLIEADELGSLNPRAFSNWMGYIGAVIAQRFIHHWFGISAILLPLLLGGWALEYGFKLTIPLKRKLYRSALFALLWLPILLSLVAAGQKWDFISGGYGIYSSLWLRSMFGLAGLVIALSASLLIFLLLVFNYDLFERMIGAKHNMEENEDSSNEDSGGESEVDDGFSSIQKEERQFDNRTSSTDKEEPVEANADQTEEVERSETVHKDSQSTSDSKPDTSSGNKKESEEELTIEGLEIERAEKEDDQVAEIKHEIEDYDPTLDLSNYKFPELNLLREYPQQEQTISSAALEERKNLIVQTLANYKIDIDKIKATIGPTVTLFEIIPSPGVRISKIKNLEDDIALSLAALGIRIIAPIPGKGTVGIEVPNEKPEIVSMREVVASNKFQDNELELPIAFGRTISNEVFITDLTKMPHLLMAGATGQGKSVGLNVIIASLLYQKHPSQLKFVMVDPKKVELSLYTLIEKHFLAKLPDSEESIITDTSKVVNTLNSLCIEMDHRYDLLKEAQVRNIKEYNQKFLKRKLNPEKGHRYMPYIVLIIDELADLMMTAGKEVETPIARLAQLARAIGIHLVIATQRPSVNIITGIIKANFPARLAFRVTSKVDSRTILDTGGADQLIGRGDMLFTTGGDLLRVQCAFVDTPEVEAICESIGNQQGYADAFLLPEAPGDDNQSGQTSIDDEELDELFDEAARTIVQNQMGSTSLLQRRLKLGYNRAGRLIDQLERAGVVGQHEGSKAREVLIPDDYSLEQFLNEFHNNRSK